MEYIPQEVLNKIKDRSIAHNIFNKQDDDDDVQTVLYCFHRVYACRENLYYSNLFFPNDNKKNDKIIYKYFKDKYVKSRNYVKQNRWNYKLFFRGNKS